MSNVVGAVLAGGKATRMGKDKAQVLFRGRPMIAHVLTTIRAAGIDALVVGRRHPDEAWITDSPDLGRGPAAGLVSALRHTAGDVLLVAVDQPLLRVATLRGILATEGDAVVPHADGHPQVTCALYRATCLDSFERAMAAGERKLRRLLDQVATTYVDEAAWTEWGEDGGSWLSIDTPQALQAAEALR